MGQKSSRGIAYPEAVRRFTDDELKHINQAMHRSSTMDRDMFTRGVLASVLPTALAEAFYAAFDGGHKNISQKDIVCGLAVFLKGTEQERIDMAFNVLDDTFSDQLTRASFERCLLPSERLHEAVIAHFRRYEGMSRDDFAQFVKLHPTAMSLIRWIKEAAPINAMEFKAPSYLETLASTTYLTENDIDDVQQTTWWLAAHSRDRCKYGVCAAGIQDLACPPLFPALTQRLFTVLGAKAEGQLQLRQLFVGLSSFCPLAPQQARLAFAFRLFDEEGSGRLDRKALLRMVGTIRALTRSPQELREEANKAMQAPKCCGADSDAAVLGEQPQPTDEKEGCVAQLPESDGEEATAIVDAVLSEWAEGDEGAADSVSQANWVNWAQKTGYPQPLLDALGQVSHLVFGLRPGSRQHEGELVQLQLQRDKELGTLKVPGAKCFLIAVEWWSAWKRYVGLSRAQSEDADTAAPQQPGQIVNDSLLASGSVDRRGRNFGLKLRKGLDKRQFAVVSEQVWEILFRWYGGGPAICRNVMHSAAGGTELELYPIDLRLMRHANISASRMVSPDALVEKPQMKMWFTFECSRTQTLRELIEAICTQHKQRAKNQSRGVGVLVPEGVRLWDFQTPSQPVLFGDINITVQDAKLVDGQQVLVEIRNEDLSWPSELYAVFKAQSDSGQMVDVDAGAPKKAAQEKSLGVTGLSNLGNTCFMNSAIQGLSNTVPLSKYFKSGAYLKEINTTNPLGMKGVFAKRYGELIRQLWAGKGSIAPVRFRNAVGTMNSTFNDYQQHDSQELLSTILDGLHEDLNRITEKPYVERKDSDGRPDAIVAQEHWEGHLLRNRSVIVDLFCGQLRSQLRCLECGFTSVIFDPFSLLTLPLPSETTAVLDVKLTPLDGSVPTRFAIEVEENPSYETVKEELAKLSGLTPAEIVFIETLGSSVSRIPQESQKLRALSGYMLTAYQIKPLPPQPAEVEDEQTPGGSEAEPPTKAAPPSDAAGNDPPQGNGGPTHGPATAGQPVSENATAPTANGQSNHNSHAGPRAQRRPSSSRPGTARRQTQPVGTTIPGHLIGVHRKTMQRQDHFLLSPRNPSLFSSPFVVPYSRNVTTGKELYSACWKLCSRLVDEKFGKQVDAGEEDFPFVLRTVSISGTRCSTCEWFKFCPGCVILNTPHACEVPESTVIALDWKLEVVYLHFNELADRELEVHESVAEQKRKADTPIELEDCIKAFTREEQLGEDESWYCPKCKTHRRAAKKLDIWSLPPVLIIHLKRFQNVNGRWSKSYRHVHFPVDGFDPFTMAMQAKQGGDAAADPPPTQTEPCAPANEAGDAAAQQRVRPTPTDDAADAPSAARFINLDDDSLCESSDTDQAPEDGADQAAITAEHRAAAVANPLSALSRAAQANSPGSQIYDLIATSNHLGILGGGHYVAYAKNPDGEWYYFNDSACQTVPADRMANDTQSVYTLFYQMRDLDVSKLVPGHDMDACIVPDDAQESMADRARDLCVIC